MRIVGYNLSHDSSIAVVENGRVKAALALERLCRVKKGTVPAHVFAHEMARLTSYVLGSCRLTEADIDFWITTSTEARDEREEKMLFSLLGALERGNELHMPFPGHHLAHASAAFYSSGFERASVLVVDAYGARTSAGRERETAYLFEYGHNPETVLWYRRDSTRIAGRLVKGRLIVPERFSGIGELYRIVTLALGFSERGTSYDDAGKTMGLAAFGKPFSKAPLFIREDNGALSFDGASNSLKDLGLIDCSGPAWCVTPYLENETDRVRREDIAAQVQRELEEACIGMINDVVSRTSERRVAASGGCFLNSVLNDRLVRENVVDDLFVFPAATDDGNAVGAALYAYYHILCGERREPKRIETVCWGPECPRDDEIESVVAEWRANFIQHASKSELVNSAAAAIARGEIVGWFEGRSEFGPRALGSRSILCHPGIQGMKDKLNNSVKFRERFRPFAASVLLEYAPDWFDFAGTATPFMLTVSNVRPKHADQIREVVHVDGTCRIQTVAPECDQLFRDLLLEFEKSTGVPLLLNTSFNLRGMPIVEQPVEALDCLFGSRLDRIFIGSFEIAAPNYSSLTPEVLSKHCSAGFDRALRLAGDSFLNAIDGRRSLPEVAIAAGVSFDEALHTALELRHQQFLDWRETPERPLPYFLENQYEPSL